MSRKKKHIDFDAVEFKVFCIRNYGTIKNFAGKHGIPYGTVIQIMAGNYSTNQVQKIKDIMWDETHQED